jgi:hypothetical protein
MWIRQGEIAGHDLQEMVFADTGGDKDMLASLMRSEKSRNHKRLH